MLLWSTRLLCIWTFVLCTKIRYQNSWLGHNLNSWWAAPRSINSLSSSTWRFSLKYFIIVASVPHPRSECIWLSQVDALVAVNKVLAILCRVSRFYIRFLSKVIRRQISIAKLGMAIAERAARAHVTTTGTCCLKDQEAIPILQYGLIAICIAVVIICKGKWLSSFWFIYRFCYRVRYRFR